jgi:hypothetical protein
MLGTIMAMAAAHAEDRTLTIYLSHTEMASLQTVAFAQNITTRILAGAGVRVRWKSGTPRVVERGTLAVVFESGAPASISRDALAYALPFQSGAAIHVLYDRVSDVGPRGLLPAVLGHVLAHEIGHVLRGDDGHQDSGVMKAHWSPGDFCAMSARPYAFTAGDVKMIHDYWTVRTASARHADQID